MFKLWYVGVLCYVYEAHPEALAAIFVGFGYRGARTSNFYWLRQMTSAALQIGLHKDPHASLPQNERDFRRRVFYEASHWRSVALT